MNFKNIFSARIFPVCRRRGFLLPAVLVIMLFLMIVVPVMVKWVQEDTKLFDWFVSTRHIRQAPSLGSKSGWAQRVGMRIPFLLQTERIGSPSSA